MMNFIDFPPRQILVSTLPRLDKQGSKKYEAVFHHESFHFKSIDRCPSQELILFELIFLKRHDILITDQSSVVSSFGDHARS